MDRQIELSQKVFQKYTLEQIRRVAVVLTRRFTCLLGGLRKEFGRSMIEPQTAMLGRGGIEWKVQFYTTSAYSELCL